MTKNRKRAQQKPPPGVVWIDDYIDPDTKAKTLGIASRLGITPSTYRKWRMVGKGPNAFRLGKLVAAQISAIDDWITAQEHEANETDAGPRPPEPRQTAKRLANAA